MYTTIHSVYKVDDRERTAPKIIYCKYAYSTAKSLVLWKRQKNNKSSNIFLMHIIVALC